MSYVYFAKPKYASGPIKIGFSKNPDIRIASLTIEQKTAIELLAKIEGDCQLERKFHSLFRDHRLHGEWFSNHTSIMQTVSEIVSGDYEVSSLPENILTNPKKVVIMELIERLPPVEEPGPTVKEMMRDLKVGQAIKTELTGGSARVYCSELNNQMKREGYDNTYRRRDIDGVVYIERVT